MISLEKRAEDKKKQFFSPVALGRSARAVAGRDRKLWSWVCFWERECFHADYEAWIKASLGRT
jgi:hypothetical protein